MDRVPESYRVVPTESEELSMEMISEKYTLTVFPYTQEKEWIPAN